MLLSNHLTFSNLLIPHNSHLIHSSFIVLQLFIIPEISIDIYKSCRATNNDVMRNRFLATAISTNV